MKSGVLHTGRRNACGRTAGFSLVEILVVLAILVIGVLGIIRIFPYGFLAIQRTTDQTHAMALINQQIEAAKNSVSVPESIVNIDPTGTISPDVLPDDISQNTTVGNDLNKIRYIVGETFRIPVAFTSPDPAVTMGNYGAVYMAQYGPIYYNTANVRDPLNPTVTGAPLQRIEQSSVTPTGGPTTPSLTSEAQYAIDYDNLKIAFYPRVGDPSKKRIFQFNYTYYYDNGGKIAAKAKISGNNKIEVPDLPTGTVSDLILPQWQDIFVPGVNDLPSNPPKIKRNSEDVSRAFTQVALAPAPVWSTDDPYEFAIYGPNIAGNGHIGIFLFNPRGRSTVVTTATGTESFTARLNYQIFDNHILRDQRSIPAAPPYDVRTSIPFVSVIGDNMLNQSVFNGLFNQAATSPGVLIYNPNNGQLISAGQGECQPGQSPSLLLGQDNFTLDAKAGTIHFSEAFITANKLQNTTVRIYYHTQKNFGLQVQKANAHYYPDDNPLALDYHSYFVGDGTAAGGLNTRVYFPKSESGKTVIVGDYYAISNDSGGNPLPAQHYTGETFQISNNPGLSAGGPGGLPYIDVKDKHSDIVSFADPKTGILPVDNVQGVSMKVRVIWWRSVDIDSANNTATPRWRKMDNDTILLPASLR